ncbi:MAG: hypothetical protein ABEI06_07660 [Halobacteriaceae archaeon]
MAGNDLSATLQSHIRDQYPAILASISDCAETTRQKLDQHPTQEGDQIKTFLQDCLDKKNLLAACSHLLQESLQAQGLELPAQPVPSPPYVVVTSRGVMLRGTFEDQRIVILLQVFTVDPENTSQYRRCDLQIHVAVHP